MSRSFYRAIFLVTVAYISVISLFLIWHRIWFSSDQLFAVAMLVILVLGKFNQLLHDWSLPTVLLLSYEYLRGLVPRISASTVHIFPMINFDKAVFGFLPTIKLQQMLFSSHTFHWYDYSAVLFYISHLVAPMVIGFLLWWKNRGHFRDYAFGLLLLSYAAFISYIIFPAMPPWMAAQQGFIPGVYDVMNQVIASVLSPGSLHTVYQFFGANLVAAVPSLHAAFPWITFLFALRAFKLKGLLLAPYVLGVWFSIVYLGEHYVFDIVIGAIYATVAFVIVVEYELLRKYLLAILSRSRLALDL